jgi:hypothetical protein
MKYNPPRQNRAESAEILRGGGLPVSNISCHIERIHCMFASLECGGKRSYRRDNPRGVVHHLRKVLRVGRPVPSGGIQLHGLSGTECARVTLQRAQERERVET